MTKRTYLFDHRFLFLLGFFFYLVSPYVVGSAEVFAGLPGIALFQSYFKQIPTLQMQRYAWITLSWIPIFLIGDWAGKLVGGQLKPLRRFPSSPLSRTIPYIAGLLAAVLLIFAFLSRHSLFSAYASYDVAARGKMSTLMVLYTFFLLHQLVTDQKPSIWLMVGLLITGLFLLSMGGRMYVTQTAIAYLVYKTSFSRTPWSRKQVFWFLIGAVVVGAGVGVWRQNAGYSTLLAVYSIFAEPLFTWFSTSTFLVQNEIPMLQFPANYASSFINLIPNSILPVKQWVVSPQQMGFTYESPLGADSAWTNIIINFGWLGSLVFLFLTGFLLRLLQLKSVHSRFWTVYYLMVVSFLPFQFFRDGFFILNKQLFFNFLILPGLILLGMQVILLLQSAARRQQLLRTAQRTK
jgi:hypothetical protein